MALPPTHGIRVLRLASFTFLASSPATSSLCASRPRRHASFLSPSSSSPPSASALSSSPPSLGFPFSQAPGRPRQSVAWRPCHSPNGRRRRFHVAALINGPVDMAEALISQLHAVSHTPWFVTIPLVALGVNLVVRLPFSLQARRIAQKRAALTPLLQAWLAAHGKALGARMGRQAAEQRRQGLPVSERTSRETEAELMRLGVQTCNRVYRRFGAQRWKLYGSLLALPPWLVVIEAIRRMSGAPVGLLGLIFRTDSSAAGVGGVGATTVAEKTVSAAADSASIAATTWPDAAAAAGAAADTSVGSLAQDSFATGGCLWFPDLTVADPYFILPFALSAMLVVNVLPPTDAGRRRLFGLTPKEPASSSPGSRTNPVLRNEFAMLVLQRTLLIMSVSVGFVTLHFPSAIHLYWLASASTSYLITHAVGYLMPVYEPSYVPSKNIDLWVQLPPPPSFAKLPKQ
ncbi:Membrane insertion protein, OxaA/YidC [Niveomyces insectorum RCEF 264]|uniref:Membrane insertion protein, OxaA/YidC n=1 Tax=Niveomyces insectorum RCEF 264 TaxID=1081102 RepID=A0A167QBC4_9HYPO|nr:Membrane insertion protein, OxaA/YidC [Niveomyces insectorum RCEF 264]